MKRIFALMSNRTKIKCVGIVMLAIVNSILASTWPVKLGALYTEISARTIDGIAQAAIAIGTFGAIYLMAECISIAKRVMLDCVIATHESEVREHSIEKLLKMPVAYYSGCMSGEKTAQLNQGVAGYSQLIRIVCNDVLTTVFTAVCTLIQVFLNAPGIIVALMSAYLVMTVMISIFQIRSQNGIREKIVSHKNSLDGEICQSISNLELIRGINAELFEKNRLLPRILNIRRIEKKHHRCMGRYDSFKQACKVMFNVIILTTLYVLTEKGNIPPGSVITVCLLFQQLVKPIDEVYRFMDETASSLIKAKVLLELAETPLDKIFDIRSTNGAIYENEICMSDVIVTNPEGSKPLAWYENIVIPGDKKIALLGPNGCGKTSLIRCLNRYYPHVKGQITLFGRYQESYSQKELTEMIYYTPQESFFFAGTVRENLLYGIDRELTDEELIEALKSVHLTGEDHKDNVIKKDPLEALDYQIGEKAKELSGGMKQRLSLARAFIRRPKLFIFDEITANLDKDATDFVLSNIEKYASKIGAGIVYISHDQKVVDRCDEIIRIKNKIRNNNQTISITDSSVICKNVRSKEVA